jgi:hypothetical protein
VMLSNLNVIRVSFFSPSDLNDTSILNFG